MMKLFSSQTTKISRCTTIIAIIVRKRSFPTPERAPSFT
jgi:hypothetical protein